MTVLLLTISVVCSTLIWPVSRWITHKHGRPEVYGFWACTSAAVFSACGAMMTEQPLLEMNVVGIGVIVGFASAIGFWGVVMYCLKIGPIGPTVAMNNMGLIWPVVLGCLWLVPHPVNTIMISGIVLVCLALVFMGFGNKGSASGKQVQTHNMTCRWFLWALTGWLLCGVSLTAQLSASIYAHDSPVGVVFWLNSVSAAILLLRNLGCRGIWSVGQEMIAGVAIGANITAVGTILQITLRHVGPEIVFPITMATPVMFTLLLGRILYGEHLTAKQWIGCSLGIAGIVALSVSQAASTSGR